MLNYSKVKTTAAVLKTSICVNGKVFCTCFLLFFLSFTMLKAQPCREIVGYYPAWKWYDRNKFVNPNTIKYDRYSIINYAFFKPNPDGTIVGTDEWADENLLQGEIIWQNAQKGYKPNTSLIDLAHQAGVKVLISIGGWTESRHFPAIVANVDKRKNFVSECVRLINFYKLDGIDIDWEYPGCNTEEHIGTPDDKHNATVLFQELRAAFDILSQKTSKQYLLTGAFGANQNNMDNIEWENIIPVMDAVNLMTYDFNGSWNKNVGHNAPLFPSNDDDALACASAAVTMLIEKYKVPASKINMGVAFYGQAIKTQGKAALHAPSLMYKDTITFPANASFHAVMAKKHLFTQAWDDKAKVPYLVGNDSLNTFVSFDNEQSIIEKAKYVLTKNLRGVLIWELTEDYLETIEGIAETPLIDALNLIFCGKNVEYKLPIAAKLPNKKELIVETETTPPQYLTINEPSKSDNSTIENKEAFVENKAMAINPEIPTVESKTLLTRIDFTIDPTNFMIIKYDLAQGGRICLKMKQINGRTTLDIDLGEQDSGYHEIMTAVHRELPEGKYRIWVDACSGEFKPVIFKEYVKD